ncbi:DnaJ domain-containing protein [Xylaria digitata]|nr:DnaJ domain-containing protein [Xylaria digitata]
MAPVPITEDFYMVLEVDQNATTEVITRSYRRLALKHHPDRNAGSDTTAAFQLLGKAYETLKDESRRRAYDLLYPSIRRCHTSPPTSGPPPASDPQPESEASEIAKLEKSKQERRARWSTNKRPIEFSIFELQREIRRLENEIKALESIATAEAAQEARNNSWSAWLLSPIYKKAPVSEEEQAQKERRKQERRVEKDMKERRLYSKQADLKKQESLLKNGEAEVNGADSVDDRKIRSLQAKIRDRETRAREARERAQREEAARMRKREQEEWEKRQREAAEQARKQQAEAAEKARKQQAEWTERVAAAARRRQEEQDRAAKARWGDFFDDGEPYFSAARACVHDGWWPKVQGRRACPQCHDTWNYLLECPGCKMEACPKCQSTIRPRRRNINR